MKRVPITALVILVISLFFFAPVFFWFTYESPAQIASGQPLVISQVYRSLGCLRLGFGDT